MSIRRFERFSEAAFVAGALVGMLAFALGVAFLILALTVGMRAGQYLPAPLDLAIGVLATLVLATGLGLRFGRGRLPERFRPAGRYGGTVLAVLGFMGVLFAVSAETTVSAPFLRTVGDKAVLFVVAFALIIGGLTMLRSAGRLVGW